MQGHSTQVSGHVHTEERGLRRNCPGCTWTFRLQKCEKINSCCLSPPVAVILLLVTCRAKLHETQDPPDSHPRPCAMGSP